MSGLMGALTEQKINNDYNYINSHRNRYLYLSLPQQKDMGGSSCQNINNFPSVYFAL